MGCTLFKRFLPGITGFYWVLLGFTGSYWVLSGLLCGQGRWRTVCWFILCWPCLLSRKSGDDRTTLAIWPAAILSLFFLIRLDFFRHSAPSFAPSEFSVRFVSFRCVLVFTEPRPVPYRIVVCSRYGGYQYDLLL